MKRAPFDTQAYRFDVIHEALAECWACGWHPGSHNLVDVHHVIPVSRGGDEFPDNLLCLCPTCHRVADRVTKIWYQTQTEPISKDRLGELVREINQIGRGDSNPYLDAMIKSRG